MSGKIEFVVLLVAALIVEGVCLLWSKITGKTLPWYEN